MIFEVGLTQEKESALQLEASPFVSRNQSRPKSQPDQRSLFCQVGALVGAHFFFGRLGIAVPRLLPQRTL